MITSSLLVNILVWFGICYFGRTLSSGKVLVCKGKWSGYALKGKGNSIACRVKDSFAAAVYWLWKVRNFRQFQGKTMPAPMIGAQIVDKVPACIASCRRLKPTFENRLIIDDKYMEAEF